LLLQVPGVVVGIGLLTRRGWARTGGLILAACYLLALPFGTAFGIYGIYILERPEVRALFRQDEAPGLGRPDPSWT
ncbi:MAG: hypothetical protein KC729_20815, partial [Candidatus Eisenbacteria bacterium]|nr:hypothetical protein [Candidatus Eisenbacteria bacterium]